MGDNHALSIPSRVPHSLATAARSIFDASLERETQSSYKTAVLGPNGYQTVLTALDLAEKEIWPATPSLIATWLSWLSTQNLSSGTSYLSGLREAHICKGLPWMPTETDKLQLTKIRKGYAKSLVAKDEPSSVHIFPITPLHIRAFASSNTIHRAPNGVHFVAASACASYGSNRGGELFSSNKGDRPRNKCVKMKHLTFKPNAGGMSIMIPSDKTHASPVEIWLPRLENDNTCPVGLVREMLQTRHAEQGPSQPDDPLFQAADGTHLTFSIMKRWTLEAMNRIGLFVPENEQIGLKSWRRGHKTAFERIPPTIYDGMKKAGRWKGDSHQDYSHHGLSQHIFAMAADSLATFQSLAPGEHIRTILDPDAPFYFHDYPRTSPFLFKPLVIPPESDWARDKLSANPLKRVTAQQIREAIRLGRVSVLNPPGQASATRRKRKSSISPPPANPGPRLGARGIKRARESSISPN
jgi:hypothetical protein